MNVYRMERMKSKVPNRYRRDDYLRRFLLGLKIVLM